MAVPPTPGRHLSDREVSKLILVTPSRSKGASAAAPVPQSGPEDAAVIADGLAFYSRELVVDTQVLPHLHCRTYTYIFSFLLHTATALIRLLTCRTTAAISCNPSEDFSVS